VEQLWYQSRLFLRNKISFAKAIQAPFSPPGREDHNASEQEWFDIDYPEHSLPIFIKTKHAKLYE